MSAIDSEEAKAIAARIREREADRRKHLAEIGRTLLAAKAELTEEQFLGWLKLEFGWDGRTIRPYIQAALHEADGKAAP